MDDKDLIQMEAIKHIQNEPVYSSGQWSSANASTSAGPAIGIPTWLIAGGIGLALGLIIGGD